MIPDSRLHQRPLWNDPFLMCAAAVIALSLLAWMADNRDATRYGVACAYVLIISSYAFRIERSPVARSEHGFFLLMVTVAILAGAAIQYFSLDRSIALLAPYLVTAFATMTYSVLLLRSNGALPDHHTHADVATISDVDPE
ncbi:hypothetical protein HY632_05345 [Candidatus Uhrbacteria bacterium]|nr:hypothetical protein [Candidatus Uhrbacteria bacterium]